MASITYAAAWPAKTNGPEVETLLLETKGGAVKNLITLIVLLFAGYSHSVVTIGPMFHLNFGEGKPKISGGIEMAYWNFNAMPFSVDLGLEFEREKLRLYSEFQTGFLFAGLAVGPVWEVDYNRQTKNDCLGIQGSLWGAFFGGINIRYRNMGGDRHIFSPGIFGKLPISYEDLPLGC